EQRGRLEELHGRSRPHQAPAVLPAHGAVAPVEEGRPQPLATAEQRGDGVDETLDRRPELAEHGALVGDHLVELGLHQLPQAGCLDGRGRLHGSSWPARGYPARRAYVASGKPGAPAPAPWVRSARVRPTA